MASAFPIRSGLSIGLTYALLLWAVGLSFNHLLYEAAISKPLANIVNWSFASAYPTSGRDRYFVFELDSAAVRDWNVSDRAWPPEYLTHAAVLKGLAADFRPSAIFYDIYFEGLRNDPGGMGDSAETFDVFLRTVCELGPCAPAVPSREPRCEPGAELADDHVLVMFGEPPYTPGEGAEAHLRLQRLVESCPHLALSVILMPKAPALQRYYLLDYPTRSMPANEEAANPRNAAFSLYARLCEAGRLKSEDSCDETMSRIRSIWSADAYLELIWGAASRPTAIGRRNLVECGPERSLRRVSERDLQALTERGAAKRRGRRSASWSQEAGWTCPFAEALLASDLYQRQEEGPVPDTQALSDRVIFVGRSPNDDGDIFAGGGSGLERLTGVYAHAMAFDNLLVFGRSAKSSGFTWMPRNATASIVTALSVMICLTSMVVGRSINISPSLQSDALNFIAKFLVDTLVVSLITLPICLVLFFIFDIGPQTWVSLTAYGAVTGYLASIGGSSRVSSSSSA